ncbi:methyltransferase domain-containing protein [Cellulomonas sp. NPDC057328]|uniref:methyltransferase domain-containing protein n=1 Tax=Cellulomonas sp. NPDC057328 TaxID=3346101 RepID=UPI0036450D38
MTARPTGASPPRPLEITDLLWRSDPVTGERCPVRRDDVVATLRERGQHRAARVAARLPATDGVLDERELDALLVRVHCELQRLGEELQLPRRVASTLVGWVAPLLAARPEVPLRVVDVGCGLGYVIRWLAAHRVLGPDVELVGVDLNGTLVERAAALARAESLPCRFVTGDAFVPGVAVDDPARTVVVSSGLLHHLAPDDLTRFFAAQQAMRVSAFAHWDVVPGAGATLGAWVFHRARMREAVSRHDGVLSARRAHPASVLLPAARRGAPDYDVRCVDTPLWTPPVAEVLRPVTGRLRSP